MAALVLAQFCGVAVGVAVKELKSAQPVTGILGGAVTNRQHLYFINVSALIGRDTDMSTTAVPLLYILTRVYVYIYMYISMYM